MKAAFRILTAFLLLSIGGKTYAQAALFSDEITLPTAILSQQQDYESFEQTPKSSANPEILVGKWVGT